MKHIFAILLLCLVPVAIAGEPPLLTVQAAGSTKLTPTALQVWVTLKEKAPDAAGGVEALNKAQAKLAEKLAPFGVKAGELKADPPSVVDKAGQDPRMRMVRSGGGRLKRKPAAEEKVEVEMQQVVRALLPLSGKDTTAIVIEAETLKAKLKAAKLVEEKAAEEGEGDEDMNQYQQQQQAPAVFFMYYAPRSQEAQSAALADAVKKANETGARAAKAIGKAGVEVYSLNVLNEGGGGDAAQYGEYEYGGYDRWGRRTASSGDLDGLTSQTPQITVYAGITVQFSLK